MNAGQFCTSVCTVPRYTQKTPKFGQFGVKGGGKISDHLPGKVARQYSSDGPPELSTPARKEVKRRSLNLMFKVW